MVEIEEDVGTHTLSVLTRPNCSMSVLGTAYLFMTILLLVLVVALGFASVGAWPVIIYAVATLIALSLGFQHVLSRSGDYEKLVIGGGQLSIKFNVNGQSKTRELNSHWVRVVMEDMPDGNCRRLALLAHGKEIYFGRHLCDATKHSVGQLLKARLGAGLGKQDIWSER